MPVSSVLFKNCFKNIVLAQKYLFKEWNDGITDNPREVEVPIPPKTKLILTSPDLLASPKLQTYLAAHEDVMLYTTDDAYALPVPPQEPSTPLLVTSIENLTSTGHSIWEDEKLYVLVSQLPQGANWMVVGCWSSQTGYQTLASFSGSRYVRFITSGMIGVPNATTLFYNNGSSISVNLNKSCYYYSWGNSYLTTSGTMFYPVDNSLRIYNFIQSKNPSEVLILGTTVKVPAFWLGWIWQPIQLFQTLTDHPYSVSDLWGDGLLLRGVPFGRIPVSSTQEVDTIIEKINSRTSILVGKSSIIRNLFVGYATEINYMEQALQGLATEYPVTRLEDGNLAQALALINSGNDFVMLVGHGTDKQISCLGDFEPPFTVDNLQETYFQSSTVGISIGCGSSDIAFVGNIGETFLTTPSSSPVHNQLQDSWRR
jgi:hypothetical protein